MPCESVALKSASPAGKQISEETLRLKELELEMRRLDLKETELRNEFEVRKMQEETSVEGA